MRTLLAVLALVATPAAPPAAPGRWQIVNAMPMANGLGQRHLYLLDTATGDTWVTCTIGSSTAVQWCAVPRQPAWPEIQKLEQRATEAH